MRCIIALDSLRKELAAWYAIGIMGLKNAGKS
eukprot:CAMPEP_0172489366 /NCGR_PEP_ID=MMETSP1066-20121228/19291_1 /TAXON_ID=671091 /ORGANISM="Coscinodiscus wailesii, Strain CCMP2513" /LENGTH=31 /DNA_ID= /DNA_START= /DNA_END= /DNA_ORIENTATION=